MLPDLEIKNIAQQGYTHMRTYWTWSHRTMALNQQFIINFVTIFLKLMEWKGLEIKIMLSNVGKKSTLSLKIWGGANTKKCHFLKITCSQLIKNDIDLFLLTECNSIKISEISVLVPQKVARNYDDICDMHHMIFQAKMMDELPMDRPADLSRD